MSNNTTTVQGGIGFTGLLTIVFIVLNLTKANTGYYNHDAMPYIPKLLEIANEYVKQLDILDSFKTMTLDDFALYQYYEKYGVKNDITT